MWEYVGLPTLCTSATPSPLAPKSRPASSPHCTGKEDRGGSAAGMGRLGDPSLPFIFDGRCGADYAFGAPFVPNGRVGSPQRTQTSSADAPSARLKGSVPHIDILWFPPFRPYACQGIIRLLLWFRWGGCEKVDQSQHGRDGHAPLFCDQKRSWVAIHWRFAGAGESPIRVMASMSGAGFRRPWG